MIAQEKEYMKLGIGKVVDNMTRRSYIPIYSMKSCDNYSNLVHSIGIGARIDSYKTKLAQYVG